MLAATLRALAIHTTNEAGNAPGPDYVFGWGLLNSLDAVEVIKLASSTVDSVNSKHIIFQNVLNNGQTFTKGFSAVGSGPMKVTIAWTDPVGHIDTVDATHPAKPQLVNDLDIRVIRNGVTYYPWILNPYIPSAAATKGDNYLDNQEQILIDSIASGDSITIQVSHKGTLTNNSQAYSLIITQPINTTLPVKLLDFTTSLSNAKAVTINWNVANENSIKNYEVERSSDGVHWEVAISLTSLNKGYYTAIDTNPVVGNNYYRLKMIDFNGVVSYSAINTVKILSGKFSFTLTPNPAINQTILSFQKGINQASLTVTDMTGKTVIKRDINLQGESNYPLSIAQLSKGIYTVSVQTKEGLVSRRMVVGK